MNVFTYKGLPVDVFSLDHCPPHVHVELKAVNATMRLEFSFQHNNASFLSIKPASASYSQRLLNDLLDELEKPANMRKARRKWWEAMKTTCLDNQTLMFSDPIGAVKVKASSFDPSSHLTTLQTYCGKTIQLKP